VTRLEEPTKETAPGRTGGSTETSTSRGSRRGRLVKVVAAVLMLGVLAVAGASAWTRIESIGHIHSPDDAPRAPVVIVFGAQLAPGGTQPMPFLAGRLDVAAQLVTSGRAKVVVVSGDARGKSGNEIQAMTAYLVARGVPARRIVPDPYGLDSYDTCARARNVYGLRRALLVTQSYHLPRSVTLCRRLGVEAEGVEARCDGCRKRTLALNTAREFLATIKAVQDAVGKPPPRVNSRPDPAVTNALRG
jgi:vancomycin permeability regulator SanA